MTDDPVHQIDIVGTREAEERLAVSSLISLFVSLRSFLFFFSFLLHLRRLWIIKPGLVGPMLFSPFYRP